MKTKLLIFGITGDLATGKLLPALEQIISTGNFDELSVIGVSRHEVNKSDLLVNCANKSFLDNKLSIFSMNLDESSDYDKLKDHIALNDNEQLLLYMAVPPQNTAEIVDMMGVAGINMPNVKILFEKPFGVDLASAEKLIEQTSNHYKEEQIYRIDHYLAKEMAQNIVAVRGRNALFSNIWSNDFIKSIEIIASQKIGIENRVHFYEQTGALRDIVQGHLIQLLALTIMEIPQDFEWDEMPKLRLAALEQINLIDPDKAVRAQYAGYREEVNNPRSNVETFVSLQLDSSNSLWSGVPITMSTGKSLAQETTEIKVNLKMNNGEQGNCIIFRIQPNEGICIELFIKKPGYGHKFETSFLSFDYPEHIKLPDAYEQVIVDAILSQKSLFTGSSEVLRSWQILKPIQDAWVQSDKSPTIYPIGADIDSVIKLV
jgi:glucose-6-phosphate 1-dehydrogenase